VQTYRKNAEKMRCAVERGLAENNRIQGICRLLITGMPAGKDIT
jgi:hypothetical protein